MVVGPPQAPTALRPEDFADVDAVYFCKGDAASLRAARAARVLVSTARILPALQRAGVRLDALVRSANDPREGYVPGDLELAPALVAATDGGNGGAWSTSSAHGRWNAAPLPGPPRDAYGAGDCFAASLAFALAEGRDPEAALAFAATRGAAALCRRGAHGSRE